MVEIDKNTATHIWRPAIDIENLIKSEKKKLFGLEEQKTFRLYPTVDKNMLYFEVLQVKSSCQFDLVDFPIDSHECNLIYGDRLYSSYLVKLNPSTIIHGTKITRIGDVPIIVNDPSLPFDFELQSLSTSNKSYGNLPYSYTGMKITMKRKILGDLLVGYYYPTAAFALLSMISFLINPDVVSTILKSPNLEPDHELHKEVLF